MFTDEQFSRLAEKYIDTVYRVALNYMKSPSDADDVTQNVFLKLLRSKRDFDGDDHIRFWLIRVTVNECKKMLLSPWRAMQSIEEHSQAVAFESPEHNDMYDAVMRLPRKYRLAIYLYYYEEYSTEEIGQLLGVPKGTVCTHLKRGRELLKKHLREDYNYDG